MTLLGRTVRLLAEASSPTALIGGVALAVHGITRYTEDADLLSADGRILSDAFWEILRKQGDRVEVRRGGEAIRSDVEARLPALPSSLRESWSALPSP